MARYSNPSTLVAVRHLAEERLRWRRPRRACRVRPFAPHPGPGTVATLLEGLHGLEADR